MPLIEKKSEQDLFISIKDSAEYCRGIIGREVDSKEIHSLVNSYFLPLYIAGSQSFFLRNDLDSLVPILATAPYPQEFEAASGNLFWEGITLSSNTRIDTVAKDTKVSPAFFAATRNLIPTANFLEHDELEEKVSIPYFSPARIFTSSPAVRKHVESQIERVQIVEPYYVNDFARSAHYMGSKRNLAGFLVEAISSVLPSDGVILDLMCGSGAASGAFNKVWRTVSSDVQEFCRILATVQGGGFSGDKAKRLLNNILPLARKHVADLLDVLSSAVDREEKILHGDIGPNLLDEYRDFIGSFPTYPNDAEYQGWVPKYEVEKRKQNPKLYPFCLFTAYFANMYFGLRQCAEIDSLRFAINQLEDEYERRWALGALITTLSALGTTHAAHFAQPIVNDAEDLHLLNLPKVLEQRAYSVFHEFSVRLMNLSEASESCMRPIKTIAGPWDKALSNVEESLKNKPVVVYLDAPYKREEYSRYYHVLETAVSYSYPSSIGKGKLPDKGTKERPRSEFFTKVKELVNQAFINVITEILRRGWMCAWSYADIGDANIVAVIGDVHKLIPCKVTSYATPYQHKSQGKGVSRKKVTEYLIILSPM